MTRLRTDAVEVRCERDVPAQFLWRGRLYLVQEVLARWTESGQWWRTDVVRALTSGDSASPEPHLSSAGVPERVGGPSWRAGSSAWQESASLSGPGDPRDGGPLSVDDGERDWWRVEAGSGRLAALSAGTGVYDLCHDTAEGTWVLARVLD
jgi:hypothetical protein